ncbi:MAG: 4Fe-4S dicluster domain-containing protein [Blastocatellales bacterium]
MNQSASQNHSSCIIERSEIQNLIAALTGRAYCVVGPTVRDGAIVYDELNSVEDLPIGWTDEQDKGHYRLRKRGDEALFGYNVGPHSWKRFLHPPRLRLWQANRTGDGFDFVNDRDNPPKYAFLGVRACELHAINIQDKVFLEGQYVDTAYQMRRKDCFIVAVNCGQAGETCFCVSMNTGPKATFGFDLALTEVVEGERHYFVVEIGTDAGAEIISEIANREAGVAECEVAERIVAQTAAQMGRTMDTAGIRELLYGNLEHPRWDDVASRCLGCANCTMACPTCFCTTVEDTTDLTGNHAERWRRWDSCFTPDFSYVHGGSVRVSTKSRYRQWMTHKLASWFDQFDSSGCVGCGRCITWCPVGIDLTEEVRAMRESNAQTERQ